MKCPGRCWPETAVFGIFASGWQHVTGDNHDMTKILNLAILATAVLINPARAEAADEWQIICKDETASELVRKQLHGMDIKVFEGEFKSRCPRIDLPSTPVHDSADPAREASHTGWVYTAVYSADGRTILSASRDGSLGLWETETGRFIRRIVIPVKATLPAESHFTYVRSAVFLGDGQRIAATRDGMPVQIFATGTGERIGELPTFMTDTKSFPPNIASTKGGLLFQAGDKDAVEATDPATQQVRVKIPGHRKQATAIAISEEAGLVATASQTDFKREKDPAATKRIFLSRLDTGEKVAEFVPEGDHDTSKLAFSRDGAQLAVASSGSVYVYSVKDQRLTRTVVVHPVFSVFDVAFTADGKGLLTCQYHPMLWDIATGNVVRHFGPFNDLCHSIDVSPDGQYAVTTSMASDLKIWEIETGTFHRRLGIDVKPPR